MRNGSSSRFSTSSALPRQPLELVVRRVGRAEHHQLDLVELVLADQAAHVRAVRAGLAAETRRVRGVADRQRSRPSRISPRCMLVSGTSAVGTMYRSQSPAILNRSASNFGRLPVPVSDARVGHERRLDLGVAVLSACAGRA